MQASGGPWPAASCLAAHGCLWLLASPSSALLPALPARDRDWGLAGEVVQLEPWCPSLVPLSGRCLESCTRRREEAISDRESPARSLP